LVTRAVVHLAHVGHATGNRVGIALDHHHRQSGIQRGHGNACPHGAAADDGEAGHRAGCSGTGFGHLAHFAFGKECVNQPGALRAVDAGQEQAALQRHAVIKRQFDRRTHGFDDLERREQPARLLGCVSSQRRQVGQRGFGVGNSDVAHTAHWCSTGQQFVGVGQPGLQCGTGVVAGNCVSGVHDAVNQPGLQRCLCTDGFAAQHELGRSFHAHQARGALGTAGTGHQAQVHLGQAHLRGGQCQAVVRTQRHFQPTTQGGTLQGGHHGLAASLDAVAHLGQRRQHRRLAKFADVGPCNESFALAHDQHGLRVGIGVGLLDGGKQALAHGGAECIHGWVVDRDYQHVAVPLGGHCG
jgi:hypothetical protein